ncbi:MAG: Mfa1 family fimbria major subunit [Muribaculaceae bacterium]|nr:Mfa1 family fimbria major subunit [Muribaculaceae bacterium]
MDFKFLSKMLLAGGVIAMASCSSEEPVIDNGDNGNGSKDGAAYMNITIKSADRMSRAISSPGYAYGTEEEQRVRTVDFFFFDNTGASMDLNAYLVDPNTNPNDIPLDDPSDDKKPNVEKVFANNLLVLEKLTGKTYPSYMLTVINAHEFKAANNIANTLKQLATWKSTVGEGYFVMSTSSYDDEETDEYKNDFYNVTPLKTTDFYLTPGEATTDKKAVEVYVERLAAKVQVSMGQTVSTGFIDDPKVSGGKLYKLSQTISGDDNTDGNGDDNTAGNGGTTLDAQLYLRVMGWNLNTTAKESYMSKNIDAAAWNAANWGWTWNVKGDYRSYWATSYTYGKNAEGIADYVDYISASEKNDKDEIINNLSIPVAAYGATDVKVMYCNENTNNPDNVVSSTTVGATTTYQVDSRVATNAVLATQIVDKDGEPIDMISANGVLFRESSYIRYILNRAYANPADLNIYTQVSVSVTTPGEDGSTTTKTEYKQIGTEFFKSAQPTDADRNGAVEIFVDTDKFNAPAVFYYFDENAADTADDPNYKEYGKEYTVNGSTVKKELDLTSVANAIEKAQEGFKAVIYENGWNVYYIPIEHLAADKSLDLAKTTEGYYGVVRNHWYKLSINSFSKVGHGIWDPTTGEHEEILKPGKPEDPLYYLGATINILSWKVVDQDVEL